MSQNINWLERLGKWRTVLTGRLLGTRLITDQQGRGARDLFDKTNVLNAELRALHRIITTKSIATDAEFIAALETTNAASKRAVTDLFEGLLQLRAKVSAVEFILLQKGIVTQDEFTLLLQAECQWLCEEYEEQFPGFKVTDIGLSIDPKVAAKTTQGWPA